MSSVNLTLATLDLKAVQSVLGAMHAADAASAKALGNPTAAFRPRDVFTPTPRFESRVVYHPTPRYEARPVLHPTPRYEPRDVAPNFISGHAAKPAIPPVWATLPNIPAHGPVPAVKVQMVRPDIRNKGTLIDAFI